MSTRAALYPTVRSAALVSAALVCSALTGCGRLSFDAPRTDGGSTGDDAGSDATPDVAPSNPRFIFADVHDVDASITQSSISVPNVEAGDLLLLAVGWGPNSGMPTVTDDIGSTYSLVGPDVDTTNNSRIMWAWAIAPSSAASVVISEELVGPLTGHELRVLQFRDLDQTDPVDGHCGIQGSAMGTDVITCTVTTTAADEFLVGWAVVFTGGSDAGTGFTAVITALSDVVEIGRAQAPGLYPVTESTQGGNWGFSALSLRVRVD